ncbi:MAG: hypothetical protein WC241_04925 [Candidatus Paceibacterota bacterium]
MKTEELIKSTDAWEVLAIGCATGLVAIRLGRGSTDTACSGLASPAALMLAYQVFKELLVFMLPPKSLKYYIINRN